MKLDLEEDIPVGRRFEYAVFGYFPNLGEEYQRLADTYASRRDCINEAIEIATTELNWKPRKPNRKFFIGKLFYAVKRILQDRGLNYDLKVWPALGTRLDHFHKVDGFFTALKKPELSRKEKKKQKSPRRVGRIVLFEFDVSLREDEGKDVGSNVQLFGLWDFINEDLLIENAELIADYFQKYLEN